MPRLTKMALVASVLAGGLTAGCDAEGEEIGSRGGIVVSEDGRFSVEIAPDALDHTVDVTITTVTCGTMTERAVGPCYAVGPRGTAFLFPAKISVELDDDTLEGVPASRLALSSRRELRWDLLADRDVDIEDGTISASASYLSAFAVITVDAPTPSSPKRNDR